MILTPGISLGDSHRIFRRVQHLQTCSATTSPFSYSDGIPLQVFVPPVRTPHRISVSPGTGSAFPVPACSKGQLLLVQLLSLSPRAASGALGLSLSSH
ncbi:hypothetical protein XENTR_v10014979 [Xenopus tropicalis]|nr:hypothetical protein XENTR_v10014979 [Xenopus tropicalis]